MNCQIDKRQRQIEPVFSFFYAAMDEINPDSWSSHILIHCTVNSDRYAFSNILMFVITDPL